MKTFIEERQINCCRHRQASLPSYKFIFLLFVGPYGAYDQSPIFTVDSMFYREVMERHSRWIAVIDDDPSVRQALLRLLRSADIKGRAFSSGAAFLGFAATSQPGCVVLDLHMPDISGFDLQSWLAWHSPEIPIIIMTGQDHPETARRVMVHRPIAYLHKPMNDQLLLDAVELALQQKKEVKNGETNSRRRSDKSI
jgi:FixJ family two-component response regulator